METMLTVRLPQALLDRIDERVRDELARRPGVRVSRADVVREILHAGLAALAIQGVRDAG